MHTELKVPKRPTYEVDSTESRFLLRRIEHYNTDTDDVCVEWRIIMPGSAERKPAIDTEVLKTVSNWALEQGYRCFMLHDYAKAEWYRKPGYEPRIQTYEFKTYRAVRLRSSAS